jgi:hypothetical protein
MQITKDLHNLELDITWQKLIPNKRAYISGPSELCFPEEPGEIVGMEVWLGDVNITAHVDARDLHDIEASILEEVNNDVL